MDIVGTQNDFKGSASDRLRTTLTNHNIYKFDGVYKGIVTRCKTDEVNKQFIRVKVFGITDDLPSKAQPWARGSGTHDIPEPGTYVDIMFENGDVHYPVWSNPSKSSKGRLITKGQAQSKQKNQEYYNSQDGTIASYDKSTGNHTFTHGPSGAKVQCDSEGNFKHINGQMGVPMPTYPVITEASLCPFTKGFHCMGSKGFQVSQSPVG